MSGGQRLLRGRLTPEEMFPAGDSRFRVRRVRLPSLLTVRVVECGPIDGPAILLLPGWGCPAYEFRGVLPRLCEAGYRAITVDLKGHGLSDKPAGVREYSTDAMLDHVVEIIDALGLSGFVLGGHSMGAALAARAAAELPSRVTALVLLSPVGTHGLRGWRLARLISVGWLRPLYPHIVWRWLVSRLLRMAYGKHTGPTDRDVDEYWAPSQYREFAPAMRDLLHGLDWGSRRPVSFADAGVPVLLVYGTRDRLVNGTRVVEDARRSPAVRVIPIRDAGHVVADETPELTSEAILEFLEEIA
jgi:pimeloyl-ACP methyl ester carboxylesterase